MKQQKLYIALERTMIYIRRELSALFQTADLTPGQFSVLEVLYHKGELTATEIGEKILTTPGNLPVILKNLEKDGLILRKPLEEDRRFKRIRLTSEGTELMDEFYPEVDKKIDELFSCWSADEKKELLELLQIFRRRYYVKDNH